MDQATKDKVIAGLRARKGDQIRRAFYGIDGTKGCAVGIMAETLGYDRRNMLRSSVYLAAIGADLSVDHPTGFLLAKGFKITTLKAVVVANDHDHWTFGEIADWLELHLEVGNGFERLFEPYRRRAMPMPHDWTKEVESYANSVKPSMSTVTA